MAIRFVRLGTPRAKNEGVRFGTVRRPPRGVKKADHARDNWYDVWLPNLAPSAPLVASATVAADEGAWRVFSRKYRAEIARPDQQHLVNALSALSHSTDFSVGCYCEDESRCHRSVLRQIFMEHGAVIAS